MAFTTPQREHNFELGNHRCAFTICVVFPIGLLWVAVDAQRRSLQDLLFGSRAIYARP